MAWLLWGPAFSFISIILWKKMYSHNNGAEECVFTKVHGSCTFRTEIFAGRAWTWTPLIDFPVSLLPQVSLKCRAAEVSQCVFQSYEAILKNWMKSTLAWTQPLPSETGLLSFTWATAGVTLGSFSFSCAPVCQSALFNPVSLSVGLRVFQDVMSRLL